MFNSLPILYSPDGSEYLIVEKDGINYRMPLYLALDLPAPVIAASPTGFTATTFDHVQIDLAWTGTADNYIVERSRELGDPESPWQEVYNGTGTSFSDTDLYPSEHYFYRLKAQVTGEHDSPFVYADDTTDPAP